MHQKTASPLVIAPSVVDAAVNGRLVQENRGGVVTRYVAGTLGSVIQSRDADENQTSSTTYWPFGEVRSSSGTIPGPWGFCGIWGYIMDALTRLYVRARVLRVDLSRWFTLDPLWPDQPPYAYATANPTGFADPSGQFVPCLVPCAPCAACLIDLLIVCPPGMQNWVQCVKDVWDNLPTWTKWLCGVACGACLLCVGREILKPEPEPEPEPEPGRPRPPRCGACTPAEHAALQAAVNLACKRGAVRHCTAAMSCSQLIAMAGAFSACAAARTVINNRCFGGGDAGHRQAVGDALSGAANCTAIARGKGCFHLAR